MNSCNDETEPLGEAPELPVRRPPANTDRPIRVVDTGVEVLTAAFAHSLQFDARPMSTAGEAEHFTNVALAALSAAGIELVQLPKPDADGCYKVNPESDTAIRIWGDSRTQFGPRVMNGVPNDYASWQSADQACRFAGALWAAAKDAKANGS